MIPVAEEKRILKLSCKFFSDKATDSLAFNNPLTSSAFIFNGVSKVFIFENIESRPLSDERVSPARPWET